MAKLARSARDSEERKKDEAAGGGVKKEKGKQYFRRCGPQLLYLQQLLHLYKVCVVGRKKFSASRRTFWGHR